MCVSPFEWNIILDGYDSDTDQIEKEKNSSPAHRQDLAQFHVKLNKFKPNASPCRCKCTPNSNLMTSLSTRRRLNTNEEQLIAAICRANRSARGSAFASASSPSCPAKPSGNFTPGEISACEWHVNGCMLAPPFLGTRIQLRSDQRYM